MQIFPFFKFNQIKALKMNRKLTIIASFAFLLCFSLKAQPWKDHGKLQVSHVNPHYIAYQDGTPFFWLADTGWEMLHRLSRQEIETYLENRKQKGFNVIQTVLVSEFMHADKAVDFYNDSIFIGGNPLKPAITPGNNPENAKEYDYWDHVDYALKTAEDKGLYLALLPCWGEYVIPREGRGIFNTTEQTYAYGNWLGKRFHDRKNIIWILGGDRMPDERPNGLELWRTMAKGIADGTNGIFDMKGKTDYSTTFMSYHCFASASKWFQKDDWLDFDMWGSYHAEVNNSRSYEQTLSDWQLTDPKPTINGEPNYEGAGINYAIDDNGYFTSTDVRMAAYWSVFSGAAGFTYGAQPIWQFNDESRKILSSKTLTNWQQALDLPGAFQIGILKKLVESHQMTDMVPDQSLIVAGQGDCGSYSSAIRGKSYAYIYIPTGNKTTIRMGEITGDIVKCSWFNPRNGETTLIGEFQNSGEKSFEVPGMSKEMDWLRSGRGCDWVLILENNSKLSN
jgi:hypothetical protein